MERFDCSGWPGMGVVGLTLSHECLVDIEQDVATFHYHPLDSQVLPYVLCLTNFILHNLEQRQHKQAIIAPTGARVCDNR